MTWAVKLDPKSKAERRRIVALLREWAANDSPYWWPDPKTLLWAARRIASGMTSEDEAKP